MRQNTVVHNTRDLEESKGKPKNKPGTSAAEKKNENVPVNCVSWNLCDAFQNQFMTADDLGIVTLWDAVGGKILARHSTGLSLSTGCIEPSNGKLLLCGGTSDSISLFEINREMRRHERTDQITLYKDYTGHSGHVTSLGFLSTDYFVTSSQDSQIGLW